LEEWKREDRNKKGINIFIFKKNMLPSHLLFIPSNFNSRGRAAFIVISNLHNHGYLDEISSFEAVLDLQSFFPSEHSLPVGRRLVNRVASPSPFVEVTVEINTSETLESFLDFNDLPRMMPPHQISK
jgi:hypothetical protein